MNSNKQENTDCDGELFRICPSKLTKHELEDLYFTVLDVNMQLRRTVQGQEDKIKKLSDKIQKNSTAQRVLRAEEMKDCCVIAKNKLRQQKDSIALLRRAHDKTSERIRRLNARLSSEKMTRTPQSAAIKCIRCTPDTSRSLKSSRSFLSRQGQSNPKTASVTPNLRDKVIVVNSESAQTELLPRHNINVKSFPTQTDWVMGNGEVESFEILNESLKDNDNANFNVIQNESLKKSNISVATQTESLEDSGSAKSIQTEDSMKDHFSKKVFQTQTDTVMDNLNVEHQIESASLNGYRLSHSNKFHDYGLCDQNKCNTLMNELKQKVSNLVQELDNTHYMYSKRIGRLEVELQEYRNINVHEHEQQYETCMNQLVYNLKDAHVLSSQLKEQLAIEKRKVAELVDLVKTVKMTNRVTKTIPQPLVNVDKQNYKGPDLDSFVSCICCKPTSSDKYEHYKANKKQESPDDKKTVVVPNTQQDVCKPEVTENLAEICINQEPLVIKPDENLPSSTKRKSPIDGKTFQNIYWNPEQHHESDVIPNKYDGNAIQNRNKSNSDYGLPEQNESLLDPISREGFINVENNLPESINQNIPAVNNTTNLSDVIGSVGLPDVNNNFDTHGIQEVEKLSELNKVQDIPDTPSNQGQTETVRNQNLNNVEFSRDLKFNDHKTRIYRDLNNDNKGQFGKKVEKDLDPNILAASLGNIEEKQRKINEEARLLDSLKITPEHGGTEKELHNNLKREVSQLSIVQPKVCTLPHITEVLFKESKIDTRKNSLVNDSAKLSENVSYNDQQATSHSATLKPKSDAQSKTSYGPENKPKSAVKHDRHNSLQIPGPMPVSNFDENRNTTMYNRVESTKDKYKGFRDGTGINIEGKGGKEISMTADNATSPKSNKNITKSDKNFNKMKSDFRDTFLGYYDQQKTLCPDSTGNNYAQCEGINTLDTSRPNLQEEKIPEKLNVQKDATLSDVPTKAQREIAMYRRNSGTLCFKTLPVSERLHCECGGKILCGGLVNKGTQLKYDIKDVGKSEQGICAAGCSRCSRGTSPVSRGDQLPTSVDTKDIPLIAHCSVNSAQTEEEIASSKVKPMSNNDVKPVEDRESMKEKLSTKRMEQTLHNITEELAHCKRLLQMQQFSSSAFTEAPKVTKSYFPESEEILDDFNTGRQYALKRGVAKHTISEDYTSKCVFVLHIGTVVLSDEAVLNSRNKSMVLTWKFYDQNVTMTEMPAGRVVLFDFSTEYEIKMTDEFLNYMKHGELKILICEIHDPTHAIASCTLPLRDALLNTNTRADMSLALIAGPTNYDQTGNKRVSDPLDSRDEMGVLDLWCMLRADANLVPAINRAIAQQSKFLTDQATDTYDTKNVLQQVTDNASANESQDIKMSFNNKFTKPKTSTEEDVKTPFHRWGSSVLRLPSREPSRELSEDYVNDTPESVSIKERYDAMYNNEPERDGGNVLKLSNRTVLDDMLKPKLKGILENQDKKAKHQIQETAHRTSVLYDLSKYPSTGRNSSNNPRTTKDMMFSKDKSIGTTPSDVDPNFTIISEVTANIKTSDDMKRVMNRSSFPTQSRVSKAETTVRPNSFLETQKVGASSTATQEMAKLKKTRQHRHSIQNLSDSAVWDHSKKRKDDQEPNLMTMHPDSVILPKERSDTSNINKKYDNIAKNFMRNEDPSKKQVTINTNNASHSDMPQRDQYSNDEELMVDITILWLALNEECEAMLNPRVQRVYVAFEFLGRSGADMETPVSLPKPKHYVEKCYFNFKKTFVLEKEDIPLLGHMLRCRAASNIPKSSKDCIVFTVISEPPEDPLGLEICEDIGYANLFLGDILAYSAGSPGYTEVIPVRSRHGTSVCGVLAVRLDGLDVLRQYLPDLETIYPQID